MKSIISLLIICAGQISSAYAQEIKVTSFLKLERDLTARTEQRRDLNDNPCSIIKVVTTGKDFQFEGNVIGEPLYRKGEVLVYMTKGSKRLTIKHDKFGVVRYEFLERLGDQEVCEMSLKLVEDKNNKVRTLVMPLFSYNADNLSYGIMVGVVRKTGGYLKVKTDFGSMPNDVKEDKDNQYWYSGAEKKSRLAVTAGLLQRLMAPLYLYVGAGYGYRNLTWETVEQQWVKSEKNSYSGVEAEVGGIYRAGNFAFSLGVQTNNFKFFEGCLGVGIMF